MKQQELHVRQVAVEKNGFQHSAISPKNRIFTTHQLKAKTKLTTLQCD